MTNIKAKAKEKVKSDQYYKHHIAAASTTRSFAQLTNLFLIQHQSILTTTSLQHSAVTSNISHLLLLLKQLKSSTNFRSS